MCWGRLRYCWQSWRNFIAFWCFGLFNNFIYVVMLSAAVDILDRNTPRVRAFDIFTPYSIRTIYLLRVDCSRSSSQFCGAERFPTLKSSASRYRSVVSSWSSGTGAAGVVGSTFYAGMTSLVPPQTTLLATLFAPLVMLTTRADSQLPPNSWLSSKVKGCIHILSDLFPYRGNQGNVIGPGLIQCPRLGPTTCSLRLPKTPLHRLYAFQALNFAIFMVQVLRPFAPNIWVIFGLIAYEGILGGLSYVNTFHRVLTEPNTKEFSMSVAAFSDALGITGAAFLAIPLHNWLCGQIA
ncbi:unnamed protein product [Mesocestoides corti]|uniref:Battenin n=1 Tax=Mesocestoides corti TaxID=53468 RepID=A0A158QVZ6_MESCO|nr:unnamed protein product [Mesocestoides corti]